MSTFIAVCLLLKHLSELISEKKNGNNRDNLADAELLTEFMHRIALRNIVYGSNNAFAFAKEHADFYMQFPLDDAYMKTLATKYSGKLIFRGSFIHS